MELLVGIGNSTQVDGYTAGLEAAVKVKEQLGDKLPDFVFVFTTIGYEQEDVIEAVTEIFSDIPMSGSTFEGIIGGELADESMYAIQIVGLQSDTIQFYNFIGLNSVASPLRAGERIGRQAAAITKEGSSVLFLFPDFKINMTSLFEGIEKYCRSPFIGGASGDNLKFQQCYQFHNGQVIEDGCCGVLMAGDFNFQTIVTHGSEPQSDARFVTKCSENTIYEIDGKPALDLASEGLGQKITPENITTAVTLMGIGFKAAYSPNYLSPFVVRAIHGFDFENGSCSVPTEVSEGTEIRFMRRDPHSVLESARMAAEKLSNTLQELNAEPKLICQFDCAGRGKVILGENVLKGVTMGQDVFENMVPWMGAFTLGEIAPVDGKNYFHNFTASLTVFY